MNCLPSGVLAGARSRNMLCGALPVRITLKRTPRGRAPGTPGRCRGFSTDTGASGSASRGGSEVVPTNSRPTKGGTHISTSTKAEERADIVGLRISHENTYLSWSRNGIIATVAAVGIHSITVDDESTAAHANGHTVIQCVPGISPWPLRVTPPAAAMLAVAGTFFSFGTVQYIAQLFQLGPLLQLNCVRRIWMGAHALGAAGFWALGVRELALYRPRATTSRCDRPVADVRAGSDVEPKASGLNSLAGRGNAGDYAVHAAVVISAAGLLVLFTGR